MVRVPLWRITFHPLSCTASAGIKGGSVHLSLGWDLFVPVFPAKSPIDQPAKLLTAVCRIMAAFDVLTT